MGLVDQEVETMLKKAIQVVDRSPDQFMSAIFLAEKKDAGFRPVKPLNKFIPYEHFKMEGLPLLCI